MGMQSLRSELEDLSFRYLMPDANKLIVEAAGRADNEEMAG